ncbi:hypothetical protein M378DRAFT_162570 [Amanita muscaria Koide BX008]|uniref:Uncharacterized protein n=1 Tax=Amanita muscaria (strain Koide BX008) TaxID=946122 RepID=A0A0C2X8E4_AMAMK|nr:hypothetical protein M378DRAFT_162570 [Amanita muscaria Koide BX008]
MAQRRKYLPCLPYDCPYLHTLRYEHTRGPLQPRNQQSINSSTLVIASSHRQQHCDNQMSLHNTRHAEPPPSRPEAGLSMLDLVGDTITRDIKR